MRVAESRASLSNPGKCGQSLPGQWLLRPKMGVLVLVPQRLACVGGLGVGPILSASDAQAALPLLHV